MKDMSLIKIHFRNFIAISLGAIIFAFGFVKLNMANQLAAGGLSGITLILHALFKLDPALSQFILNIPLLFIGYRFLGQQTFTYTVYAIVNISLFLSVFQAFDFSINLLHDNLVAALLAGVFAGTGIGIIFRFGGTTGGSDIIAQLLQIKRGTAVGRVIFTIDLFVMTLSLTYIDVNHMVYTLIASFVSAQVINLIQSGGYTVRGMLIISPKYQEISNAILAELGRGATFLHGEGAYSGTEKRVVYVVLNPREVMTVKALIAEIDPQAFSTVINVHEVMGDFTYPQSKYKRKKK
ncbi:YitT family protein [Lactococcus garvieae]|uniref:YitT family protein n=1 Tax=Lactococcus garvieae TaxID=1363 RepID=UPI0002D3366F|nr:YitT family protein [Lactococcus garvieae]EOT31154.1 hypothetical protein OO3_01705 [Lactococcus garvieae ATCC 49156]EOT95584.1 hypothetical protein I578_00182 [Lactococcus garvieae ATCC 49156]